jgi:hypothetical protein
MHWQCNAKVLVKYGTHLLLQVCALVGHVAAVLGPVSKACVHESHIANLQALPNPLQNTIQSSTTTKKMHDLPQHLVELISGICPILSLQCLPHQGRLHK